MTQPAEFRASDLVVSRRNRGEVHVNGQAWHRVLLEAHGRNEEAVNHVVSSQDHFRFAAYRQVHRSCNEVVSGCGVGGIETHGAFSAAGWVDQFWLGCSEFAIRSRIAEIPLELHSGNFHLHGASLRGPETLGRPDGTAHQVQSDKEDESKKSPGNLQTIVAVRIMGGGR